MKFLKIGSSIFAGIMVLFLIIGNVFHKRMRNLVNRNFVPILVDDSDFDEILSQTDPKYYFGVYTEKTEYHPYERILVYAKILTKSDYDVPENAVVKVAFAHDGKVIKNIQGDSKLKLVYDSERELWWGYWYPEDTTIEGDIEIRAMGYRDDPETPFTAYNHFFVNGQSEYFTLDKGLCLIGIDSQQRISLRSILSPDGEEEDWDYIPDWLEFSSADGIMMLGGVTMTFDEHVSLNSPWDKDKVNESLILAEKVNDVGGDIGIWIKTLELEGTYLEKMGYSPSLYLNGFNYSRADSSVSLLDENRKKSISDLFSTFMNDNNVSYVGFSDLFHEETYDLELLEDFVTEFMVAMPDDWDDMDFDEKFNTFVSKLNNETFMQNFELWKNYLTAEYLRDIIESTDHDKPIFYYCNEDDLTRKPEIINILFGAGVDFIVLNLKMEYDEIESTLDDLKEISGFEENYDRMVISYEIDFDNVDIQGSSISAIENFVNANLQIVHYGSSIYNVQGVMINDLYKAMSGKRGSYSSYEWMLSVSKIFHEYKLMNQDYPLDIEMFIQQNDDDSFTAQFRLANTGKEDIENLKIRFLPILDAKEYEQISRSIETFDSGSEEYIEMTFDLKVAGSQLVRKKYFIGIQVSWDELESDLYPDNTFINFLPIDVDDIPKVETGLNTVTAVTNDAVSTNE